jgi:quinoprotein glucose dehydrogenase
MMITTPLLLTLSLLAPQHGEYAPEVAAPSEEGAEAMARFQVPEGWKVELVAAEPHLANPVCFFPTNDGRFFVAETFRLHEGVTDMRQHTQHLEEDMACDTVEDRVAMFRRWAGDAFEEQYETEHERLKLLVDTDGDGVVDASTVFADGFKDASAGIAAGVLEHEGDVFYTCIPHLWRLRDTDGDGVADERESLSYGYGVRVTLLGHDLHGLQVGPDGWLYFSCGDRGFHVETEDATYAHPDTGAVLRCRLDGSDLEVVHTGLRNPQELVFDDHGELFTGDNNSDGGDKARWVQIVEGADTGWRSSYQWIFSPVQRGPWNAERLWEPHFEGQAAYVLPPIANIAAGPSGVACYPGTGFGEALAGKFLLCDFRGNASYSGVHAFRLEPRGAGYELVDREQLLWNTLVTDADFGPDGAIYFSDWVHGWNMTGKGRIYRAYDPAARAAPEVAAVRTILADGLGGRELDAVAELLRHRDRRVRTLAQFELVRREEPGWERLRAVLARGEDELASMHAVWGLGVAALQRPELLDGLTPHLGDPRPRVRAQAARVLGDHRHAPSASRLVEAVGDEDPVVRKFAAIACARLGEPRAFEALVALAADAADRDPVLRSAAQYGLSRCATDAQLAGLASAEDLHLRLAAVVALRRKASPTVALFLEDAEPLVVLEAARAISDAPIPGAYPALGALLDGAPDDDALLRRALNGALRAGGDGFARALASFALDPARPELLRADALRMLASWGEPAPRDYVLSNWEPLEPRDDAVVPGLGAELLAGGVLDAPDAVAAAWLDLVSAHDFDGAEAGLARAVRHPGLAGATRARALGMLEERGSTEFDAALRTALDSRDGDLRGAALEALQRLDFEAALPLFEAVLASGGLPERRAVYKALSAAPEFRAQQMLLDELQKMKALVLPAELHLDLIEALHERDSNHTRLLVEQIRDARREQDPDLARWRDSYHGGDAARGEAIFRENAALSCQRCHLGAESAEVSVGPALAGVGRRLTRAQIVESIVQPNRVIAAGYEGTLLVLSDERIVAGRVIEESPDLVRVLQSDGTTAEVDPSTIVERRADLSAMPEGLGQFLTPREMRDLVEYLATH